MLIPVFKPLFIDEESDDDWLSWPKPLLIIVFVWMCVLV